MGRLKVVPSNTEIEAEVLGYLLTREGTCDLLSGDHFYDPKHKVIYAAIEARISRFDLHPYQVIKDDLKVTGKLANAGGEDYLTDLVENAPLHCDLDTLVEKLRDLHIQRSLIEFYSKKLDQAYKEVAVMEHIEDAERELSVIGSQIHNSSFTTADELTELLIEIHERAQTKELPGLETPWKAVTETLNGVCPGLHIIAGRTGMGKTSYALQLAHHFAANGHPVAFYSLEVKIKKLKLKLMSQLTGICVHDIERGRLTTKNLADLSSAAAFVSNNLIFENRHNLSFAEIKSITRKYMRTRGVKAIVIDHMQLVKGDRRLKEYERLSQLTEDLKNFYLEVDIPIICLSQMNRETEQGKDKRPKLSDLRGSGTIEQEAHTVTLLYRDDYYNRRDGRESTGIAEVDIAKNKDGETKVIKLMFEDYCTRFDNPHNVL